MLFNNLILGLTLTLILISGLISTILILRLTLISILNVSVPKSIQQKTYNLSGVDKSKLISISIIKINFNLIELILRRLYILH